MNAIELDLLMRRNYRADQLVKSLRDIYSETDPNYNDGTSICLLVMRARVNGLITEEERTLLKERFSL